MARPRVCVLRAPGTNCDVETAYAFELCGGEAERVHVFRLLETPELLSKYQILCVPGGFSYGDDIGAGVIFSHHMRNQLSGSLKEFLTQDKLALGICNGFQTLLKAGLLPGGVKDWPQSASEPQVTLTWNDNGKYTARWVNLSVHSPQSVFLRGIETMELPIAHAEGKLVFRNPEQVESWKQQGGIALEYAPMAGSQLKDPDSMKMLPYPENPNGSMFNVAGLSDPTGRILGLMPHPERFIHATQHPNWTRREQNGTEGDGLKLFRNAVEYFG